MKRTRRTLLALTFAATALFGSGLTTAALAAETTTLIVLRHADRDGLIDDLNATGIERAEALVSALEGVEIDAIYIPPDRLRNWQTAAPLATARGLEPIVIDINTLSSTLLDGNDGKTVMWIGNRNNLETLWERIGAAGPAPTDYGDLFIAEVTDGKATAVDRRHFGP